MSEKKSYVCGVTVFKDGLEKHPEDVDTVKQYLKDQLVYKAINEMDAGEYVITLQNVRSFDFPVPYDNQVDFKQKLIVQPLVRCKYCKHRTRNEDRSIRVGTDNWFCLVVGGLCTDEFYCGYAERRTDE